MSNVRDFHPLSRSLPPLISLESLYTMIWPAWQKASRAKFPSSQIAQQPWLHLLHNFFENSPSSPPFKSLRLTLAEGLPLRSAFPQDEVFTSGLASLQLPYELQVKDFQELFLELRSAPRSPGLVFCHLIPLTRPDCRLAYAFLPPVSPVGSPITGSLH